MLEEACYSYVIVQDNSEHGSNNNSLTEAFLLQPMRYLAYFNLLRGT